VSIPDYCTKRNSATGRTAACNMLFSSLLIFAWLSSATILFLVFGLLQSNGKREASYLELLNKSDKTICLSIRHCSSQNHCPQQIRLINFCLRVSFKEGIIHKRVPTVFGLIKLFINTKSPISAKFSSNMCVVSNHGVELLTFLVTTCFFPMSIVLKASVTRPNFKHPSAKW
jgi:hypothetical protein